MKSTTKRKCGSNTKDRKEDILLISYMFERMIFPTWNITLQINSAFSSLQIPLRFTPLYFHSHRTDTNISTSYVKLILPETQSLSCDNRAGPSAVHLLVWVWFLSSEVCCRLPNKETQSLTNIKPNRSRCAAGESPVHSLESNTAAAC